MAETPSIKGQSYNLLRRYVSEVFGSDALESLIKEMDDQDKKIISGITLDVTWHPAKNFVNFLNIIERHFGKGDFKLCRSLGNYSAKESITRFYKIFIRFGDPGFVIENSASFWNQIHNHGRLEVSRITPDSARARVHEYKTPDKAFCNYLIGYFEGVLEMSGAKDISISEIKCVCEGDPYCEFIGKWK